MKFTSSSIDIHSDHFQDEPCLYFRFKGKFTEEASNRSTQAWHQMLESNPSERYIFVWDCEEMNGFEISARKIWYQYMNIHKRQIERVVVVGGGILIRNAARVMLEFFGLPTTIAKSREKYEELKELVHV